MAKRATTHLLTRAKLSKLEENLGYAIPREVADRLLATGARVFDPWGKTHMFDTGIGCVRLRPLQVDGETLWFMGASSSSAVHKGVPVALPSGIYERHIEQISAHGAIECALIGHLRYLPRDLHQLSFEQHQPQLYVFVEAVKKARVSADSQIRASGAVMVDVPHLDHDSELPPGISAAYVTFDPAEPSSVDLASEWLSETYIDGLLRGRALTDFDEHAQRFADAPFGVGNVMGGKLSVDAELIRGWGLDSREAKIIIERIDTVNIVNQNHDNRTIRVGAGASISAPLVIADQIESSFISLRNAELDSEAATLLRQLIAAVSACAGDVPPEVAREMGRDVQTLTAELTSDRPRMDWCRHALESLGAAATTVGPGAAAILDIAVKLGELLG